MARNKNLVTIDLIIEFAIHRGIKLKLPDIMFGLQFCDNNLIVDSIDHYFELHILEDKNYNFIKIVE